jgi:IPT/TIG domain
MGGMRNLARGVLFSALVTGASCGGGRTTQDPATPDAAGPDATAPAPDGPARLDAPRDAGPGARDAAPDAAPVERLANPFPTASALTPASGALNTALTLQVDGDSFAEDATVSFAGQRVPTTRSSATVLGAAVAAALVAQPGLHAVQVESAGGGAVRRSNILYFTVDAAAAGGPSLVGYNPDNGVPGDRIRLVGLNLAAETLQIAGPGDVMATAVPGPPGTILWFNDAMLETIEVTLPPRWQTGPVVVTNSKGSWRGPIFWAAPNLARVAVASASSQYGLRWTTARGADNDLSTSWFSALGECATSAGCTGVPFYSITFPAPQTIARIALRGNREFSSAYDILRGRLEILDGSTGVLWSASIDLPDPTRDHDVFFDTPVGNAQVVRLTSEIDRSVDPGFAELEVFTN